MRLWHIYCCNSFCCGSKYHHAYAMVAVIVDLNPNPDCNHTDTETGTINQLVTINKCCVSHSTVVTCWQTSN